jgi:hypothetical protein
MDRIILVYLTECLVHGITIIGGILIVAVNVVVGIDLCILTEELLRLLEVGVCKPRLAN